MSPDDEHALVAHEAAHAVVWCRLGVEFRSVELLTDDPLGRGGAVFGPMTGLRDRDKYLAGLLAGSVSEAQFTGRDIADVANGCGQIDFAIADQVSANMTDRERAANLQRATRLVTRNWWPISHVAALLLVHRALTEDDVHTIINQGGRHDAAAA